MLANNEKLLFSGSTIINFKFSSPVRKTTHDTCAYTHVHVRPRTNVPSFMCHKLYTLVSEGTLNNTKNWTGHENESIHLCTDVTELTELFYLRFSCFFFLPNHIALTFFMTEESFPFNFRIKKIPFGYQLTAFSEDSIVKLSKQRITTRARVRVSVRGCVKGVSRQICALSAFPFLI